MKDEIKVLAGKEALTDDPRAVFSESVLDFLEELSGTLRKQCRDMQELAAFGFWCRRSHMEEYRERFADGIRRIGRGKIFHFTASNVPGLFGYSLVMGLLTGNSNYIRLSSRSREADLRLCEIIESVLKQERFSGLARRICIFSCDRDAAFVDRCLEECSGCVAWGGDAAIRGIRRRSMNPDAVQLMFPDRYSVSVLDEEAVQALTDQELRELAHRFYNDTYAMDQNACSSPRAVIWNQSGESGTDGQAGRSRFWQALAEEVKAYPLTAHKATAKYEQFCRHLMTLKDIKRVRRFGNGLYTIELSELPESKGWLEGRFGLFFEFAGDWKEALSALSGRRLQTVTCYGVGKEEIEVYAAEAGLSGVLRVVPAGQALEMDLIWDGQNVIEVLSRRSGQEMM